MPESRPRYLVIRLSSIGDIVHTLPAVSALGRAHPQAQIHWAIEDRYSDLLQGNPYVNRVIKVDTLGWRRNLTSGNTLAEMMRGINELREFTYDAAIDFQGLMKSAILAKLSHARERIGLASRWLREPLASVFYTQSVSPNHRTHIIEINLALAEALGASSKKWEFPLPDNFQDREAVRATLQEMRTNDYIIVNPGGGWKSKCWSPSNYAELVSKLASKLPFDIIVTGSEKEECMAKEILGPANTQRAKWFPSTLLEFIVLARGAKLLIGGDTGPLHIAAAAGTPLVAIFDSTDPRNTPERNGPFNSDDVVLRGPVTKNKGYSKHLSYLEGVSVQSVVEATLQRLERAHE